MSDRTRGYLLVAIQFLLLGLIFFVPSVGGFKPTAEFALAGQALAWLGGLTLVVSAINLGRSLTANPVPLEQAKLKTSGLYAIVRHPIYLGLLLLAAGAIVQSGSWLHVIFGLLLFALLNYKARFEERLLLAKFDGYRDYAKQVGRLLPCVGRLPY